MKKIGIITVCISENFGSVLQATALKEFLEMNGFEAIFISTLNPISSHSLRALRTNIIKTIIKLSSVKKRVEKYIYFEKYINTNFRIIDPQEVSDETVDSILIGSDTVWDVKSKYFCASQRVFWALDWLNMPVLVYAASIANSSYKELDNLIYPKKAITSYKFISARDSYTAGYIEKVLGHKCLITCDPTFLWNKEYYLKKCFNVKDDYIFVYMFDDLSGQWLNEVKHIAQMNDLKIVCIDKYISASDVWLDSTIENFLSYFNNAKYVITNTFHGTVFSIIFERQFVCLDYKKSKINELLRELKLENRLCTGKIEDVVYQKINYAVSNNIISRLREESKLYLLNSLSTI